MSSHPPARRTPRRARALRCASVAALTVCSIGLAGGSLAKAAPCTDLPNPIFGIGGSAATPLIKRIGTRFAAAPEPITVVYSDPGACQAMSALAQNVPLAGTGKFWDAAGTEQTCDFPSGSAIQADWGAMAQEATTCNGIEALPETVGDYKGPISGFSLIVPNASSEFSISAEAVYYIYGLGAGTGKDVAPWNVPAAIGTRTTTSAAGLLLATAAKIPTTRPLAYLPANDVKSNQGAVDFITKTSQAAVANPSAALAFCSTENADANRATVRTLAFQAEGQDCAYFPDSTQTSTDKKNLREGRYYLWNVHHFFARLGADKQPIKPALTTFLDVVTSKAELPGPQKFIDLVIENGNVPACAMRVTRTGDMGPLASFQPEQPCGCYYDSKTTGTTPSCTACTTNEQCGTGTVCSYGFCEVK